MTTNNVNRNSAPVIQLPLYSKNNGPNKDTNSKDIKAVLDLTEVTPNPSGGMTHLNLGNAKKFNVVIPSGQIITLHFPLKEPIDGQKTRIIHLKNEHNQPPRLVSFSFGEKGIPCMRAGKEVDPQSNMMKRQYKTFTHGQQVTLNNNTKAQALSKLISDDPNSQKRKEKYANYAADFQFPQFKKEIEAYKNNTKDEAKASGGVSVKMVPIPSDNDDDDDSEVIYYDALTGDENQNKAESVKINTNLPT